MTAGTAHRAGGPAVRDRRVVVLPEASTTMAPGPFPQGADGAGRWMESK